MKLRRSLEKCAIDTCHETVWSRNFCASHYSRLKLLGILDPVNGLARSRALFRKKYRVNPLNGCWEWLGLLQSGYGYLFAFGKVVRAHRFSFELFSGPIPADLMVLHRCDNRRCVNPNHLFLGDAGDNMRDCIAKKRHPNQHGEAGRKITEMMANNIRIMFARGEHSKQALAEIYGVSYLTISNLLCGKGHLRTGCTVQPGRQIVRSKI